MNITYGPMAIAKIAFLFEYLPRLHNVNVIFTRCTQTDIINNCRKFRKET